MLIRRITIAVLVVYAALTLYTTLAAIFGLPYHPVFTPLLTLISFLFASLHAWQALGWRRMLLLLVLTFSVSLLFESVGVATGLIYGAYHYTDKLGFKFLGLVPLLIPIAWFMMTYPSFVIASYLVPRRVNVSVWRLGVAAIGALVMTAWDLAMDPMMVGGGHWVWDQPGAYFGVPLHNYAGWWLTVFVTFVLFLIIGRISPVEAASPEAKFRRLPILSYAINGLSVVIVDLRFGLGGPALVGLFAMFPWVLLAWNRSENG